MLAVLPELPDHVLGIRASGEIVAADYEAVLVPAVEEKLQRHKKLRLLFVLGADFEGYTAPAAWEDTKIGVRHFTDFDRIAVVTDESWVGRTIKAFGFVFPGEVKVFDNADADKARSWICEPRSVETLEFTLLEEAGVLILQPGRPLEANDFKRVASMVDPYIARAGSLAGVVVIAERFPGWEDFSAMTAHFRFIKDHQAKVRRVALVTNSRFLSTVPQVADRLIDAEIRQFPPDARNAAIDWAAGGAMR